MYYLYCLNNDIRYLPIVANKALLATLQETKFAKSLNNDDRETASDLLPSIVDDEFLFMLHFHYDLHECVLGKIVLFYSHGLFILIAVKLTKLLQDEDLPYFTLTSLLNEKKNKYWNNWLSEKQESTFTLGSSLADYIHLISNNNSYGAFQIVVGDRNKLFEECFTHINQLLFVINKRFNPFSQDLIFVIIFIV